MLPIVRVSEVYDGTSASTTGTSILYVSVVRIGEIPTLRARSYSEEYSEKYLALQAAQKRESDVAGLIEALGSTSSLERFHAAVRSLAGCRAGTATPSSAAGDIRTLLDGVQGDLFAKARKWEKENMTWEEMSGRLAIGGHLSPSLQQLLTHSPIRSSLMHRLGNIVHERPPGTPGQVQSLWAEALDHLFVVLRSVRNGSSTPPNSGDLAA